MITRQIKVGGNSKVTDTAGLLGPTPDGKPAPPPTPKPVRQRLPLGDYTERMLSSVGVTPERYAAAKAALGMAPTCNCHKRKEWLNRAGEWLASLGS
jgi:hypothetical protein